MGVKQTDMEGDDSGQGTVGALCRETLVAHGIVGMLDAGML